MRYLMSASILRSSPLSRAVRSAYSVSSSLMAMLLPSAAEWYAYTHPYEPAPSDGIARMVSRSGASLDVPDDEEDDVADEEDDVADEEDEEDAGEDDDRSPDNLLLEAYSDRSMCHRVSCVITRCNSDADMSRAITPQRRAAAVRAVALVRVPFRCSVPLARGDPRP